jgi:hypothetical protein
MTTRKYMSEAGIHVFVSCVMLLQQTDFEKMDNEEVWRNHLEDFPSHIYSIVRRPRVMVDEASLSISEASVSGKFMVRSAAGTVAYPFQIRNGLGSVDLRLSAPYPHYILFAHDKSGVEVSAAKASLLASLNGIDLGTSLAFEVLYVGQAYGVEGSRTSMHRLASHETLQAIYSKAAAETPDLEIWVMLWHLTPNTLLMFDGVSKDYLVTDQEDEMHLKEVLNAALSDQQIINFTEAAMIRHFQPEFNIRFKNSFPSPAHETYAECYQLDLNAISIEVETEEVHSEIWSKSTSLSARHFATFPLHSPEERRSMFEMLLPDKSEWVDLSKFSSTKV